MHPLETEIIYAINDNPKYILMVRNSLRSLRLYNSKVPVSIYVYGESMLGFEDIIKLENVKCFQRSRLDASFNTYLKWYAIKESKAEKALFLDADTIVFDDVEKLFKKRNRVDLYARQEIGTQNKKGIFITGCYSLKYQLNHEKLSRLTAELHTKPLPFFFNSGIMLISKKLIEKIKLNFNRLVELKSQLEKQIIENPTTNQHILEEVAANLFLAELKISTTKFKAENVPFYFEYKSGLYNTTKAVVTHVLGNFYPYAMQDLLKKDIVFCLNKKQLKKSLKQKSNFRKHKFIVKKTINIVIFLPDSRQRAVESLRQKLRLFKDNENVYVMSALSKNHISKFIFKKNKTIQISKNTHPIMGFIENIQHIEGDQWVFVDTFCMMFSEISSFLKKYSDKDVFGIEYKSATQSPYDYYLGNAIFEPLLYKPALNEISTQYGVLPSKVFGNQFLVINGSAREKIQKNIHELKGIVEHLKSKHMNVFNQPRYLENYAFGLLLELNKQITSGYISTEDFINYMQLKSGEFPMPKYMLGVGEQFYSEIKRL